MRMTNRRARVLGCSPSGIGHPFGQAIAAGGTVLASIFAAIAARSSRDSVRQTIADARLRDLRTIHDLLIDIQEIPLAGDFTELNQKTERLRRLEVLSPFDLEGTRAVLDGYQARHTDDAAPDPRDALIPAALSEIEALIQRLQEA